MSGDIVIGETWLALLIVLVSLMLSAFFSKKAESLSLIHI